MISISNHVRSTIGAMLAHPTVGFNPTLGTIANDYGCTPFTIDYRTTSNNFFTGYFTSKNLLDTSNISLPMQCLYTLRAMNTNSEKYAVFAGTLDLGIDTYISFGKSGAPRDTDTVADAVEATLYNVFHQEANMPLYGNVTYSGDLTVTRFPLQQSGTNWLQLVQARLSCELTAL